MLRKGEDVMSLPVQKDQQKPPVTPSATDIAKQIVTSGNPYTGLQYTEELVKQSQQILEQQKKKK
jgi:hypothetical protein